MVPNGKLSDIQITAEIPIIPQPDIYNLNTGLVWYLYPYCNCRLKRITCSSGLSWESLSLAPRGSFLTMIFRFDFDFFGEFSRLFLLGESSFGTFFAESRNLSELLSSVMVDDLLASSSLTLYRLDLTSSVFEMSIESLPRCLRSGVLEI